VSTRKTDRVGGYKSERSDVQAVVPLSARCILEIGCSTGVLGASLKARQPATILGVEFDAAYAEEARRSLDRVVAADASAFADAGPPEEAPFDCLVCADVLEHLVDPWHVLAQCARWLTSDATVIVSVPNILYMRALARVVRERRWPRDLEGIFDETHLRWFTLRDATDLVNAAGLKVVRVVPNYYSVGWKLRVKRLLARSPLDPFLPGQYILVARPLLDYEKPL
jgi:2-polyprenyl-3-methyl-5-hydroxy-6-metoxy-1,4-benzoquinol methylase